MDEDVVQEREKLGNILETSKCGFSLESEDGKNVLVYFQCPDSSNLCQLSEDVVVKEDPILLRKLCEKNNLTNGFRSSWICQRKEIGRLYAQCTHGGISKKSNGRGIRKRISKKVGCKALVSTVPLARHKRLSSLQTEIRTKMTSLFSTKDINWKQNETEPTFCVLRVIQLQHSEHIVEKREGELLVLKSTADVLANVAVVEQLKGFLNIFPSGKGCLIKAQMLLHSTMPTVHIPQNVLKSVITQLRNVESDAQCMIDELRKSVGLNGIVEYFKHTREDGTGVLDFVAWSYKGAKEIVQRCGDVLFWDSTHNVTRYDYKLSSLTLVDSEGKSRCVMLSLMLHERAQDFQKLINCWHDAFDVGIPSVVFTDGDDGMSAAISSLSYSHEISHMLCSFHLFDMNAKKKIQPLLTHGGSSWPLFRKKLSLCREATDECTFQLLWDSLLDGEFRSGKHATTARRYLDKYIFSKRKQWALSFNEGVFTLGASTTQRSESWNAVVKAVAKALHLNTLVPALHTLVKRQSCVEVSSKSTSTRKERFNDLHGLLGRTVLAKLVESRISRYACFELKTELQAAFTLKVETSSVQKLEGKTSAVEITSSVHDVPFYFQERKERSFKFAAFSVLDNSALQKMKCSCFYPARMKLPCRHIIQLALHLDKEGYKVPNMISETNVSSWLEFILLRSWSPRWKNPFSNAYDEYQLSSDYEEESEYTLKNEHSEISNVQSNPIKEENGDLLLEIYKCDTSFPSAISDGGGRVAFAKLNAQFRALSEVLTRSDEHLKFGKMFYDASDSIINRIAKWEVLSNRTSKKHLDILSQDLGTLLSATFIQPSEKDSVESNASCQSLDSMSIESNESSTTDETHQTETWEVLDPQKRMDYRTNNKSNVQKFKSRAKRSLRRSASRRAARHSDVLKSSGTVRKQRRVEFACPHCTEITPQNNPENVRQHINSKHSKMKYTYIQQMREAGEGYYERIGSSSHSQSPIVSLDNTEFDTERKILSKEVERKTELGKNTTVPNIRESIENNPVISKIWKAKVTKNVWDNKSETVGCGACVEVFWKLDLAWYRGKLGSVSKSGDAKSMDVFYSDGDMETVNLEKEKWRIIKTGKTIPEFTLAQKDIISDGKSLLEEANVSKSVWLGSRVGKFRSSRVSRSDLLSLQINSWLTDGIVELFISCLCQYCEHVNDNRFAQIDSQAIVLGSNHVTANQLSRTMNGLPLHEIDVLIWPICYGSHWYLSVAYVDSREILLIDPKRPTSLLEQNNFLHLITSVFGQLTKTYDKKYNVAKQWRFKSPKMLSTSLVLPKQPAENGNDCGVLVCLYAWAILTGQKVTGVHGNSFTACMEKARYTMLGLIKSWMQH